MKELGLEAHTAVAEVMAGESQPCPENTAESLCSEKKLQLVLTDPPGKKRIRREVARVRDRIPSRLAGAIEACVTGRRPWPLFVFGGAGVGKTCAALYLCDRVPDRCEFRDFVELCEELRLAKFGELWTHGSHDSTRLFPEDVWDRWATAELAVLDEIGTRSIVSDHQYETLKMALDRRMGKPLILLSNHNLETIAQIFDDRVASRCAGTVVQAIGPDQRLLRSAS